MFKMNRRLFLASSSSLLFLPQLEALTSEKKKVPKRIMFLGISFGFTKEFYPETFGKNYRLTSGMKPLAKHKSDFTMISNLSHKNSTNVHSGTVAYLTGANCFGTPGKKFHNTVSCDQVAARYMGKETRFSSIELSCKESYGHGKGSSLAWNEKGQSLSGIHQPFSLFQMLFGKDNLSYEQRLEQLKRKKSVLDAYVSDIKSLNTRVSQKDTERLDQYFQSMREIEQRIERERLWAGKPKPKVNFKIKENYNGYEEIKTMYELMVLAMQTDMSRVLTYRQPLTSLLHSLNLKVGGHQMSHYTGSNVRRKASEVRDIKQSELLAHLIDKLKNTADVDGSRLFDNCLLSFGGNLRTGHILKNVPAIITGNVDNKLKHGSHIKMPEETALCNLWLTLLQSLGLPEKKFGDSDGIISEMLT